jgi:cystathionine gamma-lyase
LCEVAHAHGALVAVDNTTVTALGQQPLALGADFSVASDTKALTGHSDVVLGHVSVRQADHWTALLQWRTQMGAIPGPMEVWLAQRSLGTLALRLERQSQNALAIAQHLAGQASVKALYYPGLPTHPGYGIGQQQMRYSGPVVTFELADAIQAEAFLSSTALIYTATSFGGLHSMAERRARWSATVPPGLIRLSAGCEDTDDLVADVAQALANC